MIRGAHIGARADTFDTCVVGFAEFRLEKEFDAAKAEGIC
jgi:hypothetical protein